MFNAATLFALQPEAAAPSPNPAEKVLCWAQDLDRNAPQLEAEAARVEQILETLSQPTTTTGTTLMTEWIEVLEAQLEGIYGLLDFHHSGDQQIFQHSLQCLLDSDARLQMLEHNLAEIQEELPLMA